ncbi:serine/threonine-protein kinase BtrW [Roseovarius sp. A-2]|uniref:ATP-binding protein n=1 Tax=Roseovarius sp. A-2 TaxID=1570360 RepID=UPI0009CE45A9|nr:ATP-binding protein [Roseovarius sp. A-2]GAW34722.1 serine/threonine-protein kinase BtrW [Roseovarius sp. A-2]
MADSIRLDCIATESDVRDLLIDLRARLLAATLSVEDCGTIEIALAEALNNIVEHAFPSDAPGRIALRLHLSPARLRCELRDQGTALPGLAPPDSSLPELTGPPETLPEGGFGWSLIRTLTERLHYERHDGENRLTLEFNLRPS